jgi:hypothetical protein
MLPQPCGERLGFAVGQDVNPPMADRVDQQARIPAAAAQREVVHAQRSRHRQLRDRGRHQHSQHRAPRDPRAQPSQHRGTGPAGRDHGQVGDQRGQLPGAARPPLRHGGYLLTEGPPRAGRHHADQATNTHLHDNSSSPDGKISQLPLVIGMHPLTELPTLRARRRAHRRPGNNSHGSSAIEDLVNDQRG